MADSTCVRLLFALLLAGPGFAGAQERDCDSLCAAAAELVERFELRAAPDSARERPGWQPPKKIVVADVPLADTLRGLLPGIDLNARLALVPLLNLSLVCKEMLSGVWHWGYIALIFGSSCLYAAAALGLAVRMFSREEVLFRA